MELMDENISTINERLQDGEDEHTTSRDKENARNDIDIKEELKT